MSQCPRCRHENRERAKFCEQCAAPLVTRCTECGTELSPTAKFCSECGNPTSGGPSALAGKFSSPDSYTPRHLAERILTSRHALVGERKQLTVLFCDLVGSTAMAERLGPEPTHTLLSRFFELALAEVHRFEGTINQFLGDGFMALFGAPVAHEDHARRAVLAALAIRRALHERGQNLAPAAASVLSVRMGLNSGPVVVGAIGDDLRMDYTAIGDTTNLAARLQQRSEPGTILLSENTARLVRRDVVLEAIGSLDIRGKSVPVPAYLVLGVRPRRSGFAGAEGRTLSPFVGRERELATLHDLVALVATGQGQAVAIVGEPGVGKSRLLHELAQSLTAGRFTWLEGRCLSYGATIPYLPVIDILRAAAGIAEEDAPDTVAAKLRAALEEVGVEPNDSVPYLLHLLGIKEGAESVIDLSPTVIKLRTFRILREMSVKGARRRPIVFVIEDVHWIDRSSEEYFTSLVEGLAGVPVLLVTTSRPGYRTPWVDRSYATQLTLRPLSTDDSRTVARSIAPRLLSRPLADTILGKAEGNPFFLEELTRSVLERGAGDVPDSIHSVLAARIDRLPAETKAVLQTASVLGREFSSTLLEAVWRGEDLGSHLGELRRRELLYERGGDEDTLHVFKHALTQDVAYESLLHERRRQLHAQVVGVLERIHAERLDEHVERLAHHAVGAEMWEKTVRYAKQAGLKAVARSANREATAMFEQAIAALERLPENQETQEQAIDLRFNLKNALVPLGELRRAFGLLEEAEYRARVLDDHRRLGWTLMHRCHLYWLGSDLVMASQVGENALAIATSLADVGLEVPTHFYLGATHASLGNHATAVGHLERSVELIDADAVRERFGTAGLPAVLARGFLAVSLAFTGNLARASVIGDDAIRLAETADDPYSLALALWGAGFAYQAQADFARGTARLERGLMVCHEWRFQFLEPLLTGTLGHVRSLAGQMDEGLRLLEEGQARAQSIGFLVTVAYFESCVVEGYVLAGRLDDAERRARAALTVLRERHMRGYEAMVLLLLGDIAAGRDPVDVTEAESHYREALGLAMKLGMRPLVAHCHAGLGKLYRRTGTHTQADEHFLTATAMYREMGMAYWLEQAEAAFKGLA